MTLTQLLTALRPLDPSAALVFTLGDTTIGAGYHVTELIHGQMTGIDCGAHVARWQETRVQLLDGSGRDYMRLGTFIGILEKSIARLRQMEIAGTNPCCGPGPTQTRRESCCA